MTCLPHCLMPDLYAVSPRFIPNWWPGWKNHHFQNAHRFTRWLVQRNQDGTSGSGIAPICSNPNIKEGKGGLRDYHTMLWLAGVTSDVRQRRDLEYYGYLSMLNTMN